MLEELVPECTIHVPGHSTYCTESEIASSAIGALFMTDNKSVDVTGIAGLPDILRFLELSQDLFVSLNDVLGIPC